ncbi:hypothetical protein DRI50_00755 [candidate division KSB1 bacterium]|nr:MAG: hypothetical protein DRI50_00755 [candidate division KSB1 bacterium]
MKNMHSKVLWILLLIFTVSISAAQGQADKKSKEDYYQQLKRGWGYMQKTYELLNRYYVDEIRPYPLLKAGIEGMLDKLDPYTVFIEREGENRLRMITVGKYGGVGMEVGLRNKKVTVIAPIENSPASRSGIQAGDIILKINGKDIKGWSLDKVSNTLRGKVGTKVTLLIRRPGLDRPFEITLTRAEIVLKDVGYAGFLDKGIGYVSLKGFTEKAPDELKMALEKLQKQQPLKGLILDLRGNPGGLLESAVEIVNIFVPKNTLVVYTKGYREKEYRFYTQDDPMLPNVPLVVLVNGGSASASEIVTGALQDLDRAVIVGKPTFGKGLVQKIFNIDKIADVKLKITTARYYIPSGRCIQKRDYAAHNEVIAIDSTDSTHHSHKFFTRHHRLVHDRGGIEPDVIVHGDSLSTVSMDLIRKNLLFDFAVKYHQEHPQFPDSNFTLTDQIKNQFKQFLKEKHFQFKIEGESELSHLKKLVQKRGYDSGILSLIDSLKTKLEANKKVEFKRNEPQIFQLLRMELAEKYGGSTLRSKLSLQNDKQADKAVELLRQPETIQNILMGNGEQLKN